MTPRRPNVVSMTKTRPNVQTLFRKPKIRDGAAIHQLIEACPPLDLNSVYNYLILCKHFRETCVVVEEQGEIIAFTSGYIPPATPEALFIWQVAVGPKARKRGFGKRLLGELIKRPVCRNVRYLETTITPSNKASWSLFKSFARDLGTDWNDDTLFEGEHFGESGHEPEQLLRIGPFRADSPQRLAKSS